MIQRYLKEIDEGWKKCRWLMSIMDEINDQFGRGTLEVLALGLKQIWWMQLKL